MVTIVCMTVRTSEDLVGQENFLLIHVLVDHGIDIRCLLVFGIEGNAFLATICWAGRKWWNLSHRNLPDNLAHIPGGCVVWGDIAVAMTFVLEINGDASNVLHSANVVAA